MTLFSNSSKKAYQNNTIAAFAVELAHEVDLSTDRWEVELCEFLYPPSNVGTLSPNVVVGERNAMN